MRATPGKGRDYAQRSDCPSHALSRGNSFEWKGHRHNERVGITLVLVLNLLTFAARVGGQGGVNPARAWIEGFSFAHTTNRRAPTAPPPGGPRRDQGFGRPSRRTSGRAGRSTSDSSTDGSRPRAASARPWPPRPSRPSRRSPARSPPRASSAPDQRESGMPFSAGSSHASALTSATAPGEKRRGRPGRGLSSRPCKPSWQNRFRHVDTASLAH